MVNDHAGCNRQLPAALVHWHDLQFVWLETNPRSHPALSLACCPPPPPHTHTPCHCLTILVG
jgi:hypothetical protein